MTSPTPRKKPVLLAIQIIAILLLAFGIAVSPTLMSSAPAYNRSWDEVFLSTAVIAAIVFGLSYFLPSLGKWVTVPLVLAALVVPAIIVGLVLVTHGERLWDRMEVQTALRKAMKPAHVEDLAAYLQEPSGPLHGLAPTREDMERLRQYVATLPVEELKKHRAAERLLKGLEIRPTEGRSSQLPDESLEVLCHLYVDLQQRLELKPDALPLDSRQRARVASRIAEVGLTTWRGEVVAEHRAYVEYAPVFYKGTLDELFPKPLAPGERVYSATLGSLPLYRLLARGSLIQPEPGTPPPEDPYDFETSHRKETSEDLAALKAHGLDFTEEELRDKDLQTYLANLPAP